MNIDINQADSCYLLGYFWADCFFGATNIEKDYYNFSFEIKTSDFIQIWPMLQHMGFEKYSTRKRKNSKNSQSCVRLYQREQLSFFKTYNFHKKYDECTLYFSLTDEMKIYFVKGFLDGDGSISIDKNGLFRIGFNGPYHQNWNFLEHFCNTYNIKYVIYRKERVSRHETHVKNIHKYSVFEFTNRENRLNFCEIFKDINIGLTRKFKVFENYKNWLSSNQKPSRIISTGISINPKYNTFIVYSITSPQTPRTYIGTFKTLEEAITAQNNFNIQFP